MTKRVGWRSLVPGVHQVDRQMEQPAEVPVERATVSAGLSLGWLGFGAAPLGNLYREVADADADGAVAAAIRLGLRYFDVAPQYGRGLAEERLGSLLARHAGTAGVTLSSKVGIRLVPLAPGEVEPGSIFKSNRALRPEFDYSYDGALRSIEASSLRLGRSIDIAYGHDLGRRTHGEQHERRLAEFLDGAYRALSDLRAAGEIQAIGIGVNECEVCEEFLRFADLDLILLAGRYTLLEQDALDSLLPLCTARGVRVVIGGPYNSGILATGTRRNNGTLYYDYRPASSGVLERVKAIEAVCDAYGITIAAAALQFPLGHPQVVSVIPGLASAEEVAAAAARMQVRIPPQFWEELKSNALIRSDAPTPAPVDQNVSQHSMVGGLESR